MSRYKCTVSYKGAAYVGWQSQKEGTSVQEQIEGALSHLCNETIHITASGRTDKGVSAAGQVFHFDSDARISEKKWKSGMNALLPEDIYIRSVEKTDELFHARYCVFAKQYDYRINLGEYDVFTRDYVYQCPYEVDVEAMKEAAQVLVGKHDFSSFCSNSFAETPDQVRTLYSVDFSRRGDILTISFYGKGFLRYMVRMMVAQLLEAGRGRITAEGVKEILDACSKNVSRRKAKPEGLSLERVDYFTVYALNHNTLVRSEIRAEEGLPSRLLMEDRRTQQDLGCVTLKEEETCVYALMETARVPEAAFFRTMQGKLSREFGGKPVELYLKIKNEVDGEAG